MNHLIANLRKKSMFSVYAERGIGVIGTCETCGSFVI